MQFFSTILVGATALISFAAAQSNTLFFTSVPTDVEAGTTYTIAYTAPNPEDPVTITLREGPSGNLDTIATLTSTSTGGTYQWTVSDSYYNSAQYALQITQGDQINYSGQFALAGGDGEEPESSSSVAHSTVVPSSSAAPSSSATPSSTVETTVIVTTPLATPSSTPQNSTLTTSHSATPTGATQTTGGPTTTGSGPSAPTDTGAAVNLKSPAALVLGAIVALAYLQ